MGCRHENEHRTLCHRHATVLNEEHMWHQVWCAWCGEWLPLGAANDEPEAVRVEIRAAELSRLNAGAFVTGDAWSGWDAHAKNYDPPPWPHCPDAWAGYLARQICQGGDDE